MGPKRSSGQVRRFSALAISPQAGPMSWTRSSQPPLPNSPNREWAERQCPDDRGVDGETLPQRARIAGVGIAPHVFAYTRGDLNNGRAARRGLYQHERHAMTTVRRSWSVANRPFSEE